jgi:hypothetical protein
MEAEYAYETMVPIYRTTGRRIAKDHKRDTLCYFLQYKHSSNYSCLQIPRN